MHPNYCYLYRTYVTGIHMLPVYLGILSYTYVTGIWVYLVRSSTPLSTRMYGTGILTYVPRYLTRMVPVSNIILASTFVPWYLQAVRLCAVAVFAATFPDRRKGFPARADP